MSHEAKYITAVKSIQDKGRPAIHVEYSPPRAGAETRIDVKDICLYIMDEDEERYWPIKPLF